MLVLERLLMLYFLCQPIRGCKPKPPNMQCTTYSAVWAYTPDQGTLGYFLQPERSDDLIHVGPVGAKLRFATFAL